IDALKREIELLRSEVGALDVARIGARSERAREIRQADLFASAASIVSAPSPALETREADEPLPDATRGQRWAPAFDQVVARSGREQRAPRLVPIDGAERPRARRERAPVRLSREHVRAGLTGAALLVPALGLSFALPVMALSLTGLGLSVLSLFVA